MRSRQLFSYVVDHDEGFAPNPAGGLCTLAYCKFSHSGRRNLVEMAAIGDWVAGTGGKGPKTAGHGRLVYAMRVTQKMSLARYSVDRRFEGRIDRDPSDSNLQGRFVLISNDFFYFGRNAVDLTRIPKHHLLHEFEKRGPNYRRDFRPEFIADFDTWLHSEFTIGIHGAPCAPYSPTWDLIPRSRCAVRGAKPPCPPKRKEKLSTIC